MNIDRIPRDRLPLLWAEWVGGYATLVGRIGIEDNNPEFWTRSRDAFIDALKVVPREQDPRLCLILNREWGRMCHQCADWEGSLAVNREAASIGISLADAAGTNMSRANELETVTRAIHFAAYAAVQLGRSAEAAELAEMGRAPWLDEAIQLAAILSSSLSNEAKIAVDEAQAAVLELERREINGSLSRFTLERLARCDRSAESGGHAPSPPPAQQALESYDFLLFNAAFTSGRSAHIRFGWLFSYSSSLTRFPSEASSPRTSPFR